MSESEIMNQEASRVTAGAATSASRPAHKSATSDDERKGLVDLDSSVVAYAKRMREEQEKLQAPGEPPYTDALDHNEEPPHIRARRKLIQRQPGFWKGLERIELGFEVVQMMREIGFGLHIVTKGPSDTANAWSEKLEWSKENIPDALVTVTEDKSATYGRAFLEDWPPYFLSWLAVRKNGLVICVAQPWNVDYAVGGRLQRPNVIRYDGTNRAEVDRLLRRAYERKGGEPLFAPA
jgi:hypothetical protein